MKITNGRRLPETYSKWDSVHQISCGMDESSGGPKDYYSKPQKGNCDETKTNPTTGLYEPYFKEGKKITEIARFNPVEVFLAGFIPPVIGSISAIAIALIFHNEEISNYNWQCGRARLPSLSRIINLPVERTFWQLFLLFHVPLRVVELITGFNRYNRLRNIHYKRIWLYEVARYAYLYVGLLELIFLSALSVIGERENIRLHVIFFYVFGICGIGFMIANIICHRQSLYYLNPYGRRSYYLKIGFCTAYVISVPILVTSFLLYWKKCITLAYDVFAVCEYVGVFLNICYHGCAYYDIRHKVTFTVRLIQDVGGSPVQLKNIKNAMEMQEKTEDIVKRTRG